MTTVGEVKERIALAVEQRAPKAIGRFGRFFLPFFPP